MYVSTNLNKACSTVLKIAEIYIYHYSRMIMKGLTFHIFLKCFGKHKNATCISHKFEIVYTRQYARDISGIVLRVQLKFLLKRLTEILVNI